ncbi:MAG: c-type cytochrome [Pseudomonadota bacterium]
MTLRAPSTESPTSTDLRARGAAALVAAALLAAAFPASAQDAAAGRLKAIQCQACHGLDGLSKLPESPHLAGQNDIYLIKALKDYRSGARKDPVMSIAAASLTDTDISDLAAYFSSIEVIVKPPQ